MYNVEEAYVATIKESGAIFKKLCNYVDAQIQAEITNVINASY